MLRRAGCFNLGEQGVVEGGGMRARERKYVFAFVCVCGGNNAKYF